MSKKMKTIIGSLAAIIVLIATLIILKNLPVRQDMEKRPQAKPPTSELTINNNSANDIVSIEIKNTDDSYIVNADNGFCSIAELSNIKTSQEYFAALTADAAGIAATQVVEENSNKLSEFGLEKPRATVLIRYKDGSSLKLNVGNDAPASLGAYVNINDETKVYLFSWAKVDTFLYSKIDFIDREVTPKASDNSQSIKITLEGKTRPQPVIIEGANKFYSITAPKQKPADVNAATNLVEQLEGIKADKAVIANPTAEQLAEYGLADPYSKVTADYESNHITLISSEPKNDKLYLMNTNIPVIYQIASSNQTWGTAGYQDLASKTVISEDISNLRSLTISPPNNNYVFEVSHNNNEISSVKCNGKDIDIPNFKIFYQNVLSLKSQGFTDEATSNDHIMTCSFQYKNPQKPADLIKFYNASNANSALIELNGQCDSFEYKSYVHRITEDSRKLAASEKIDPIK